MRKIVYILVFFGLMIESFVFAQMEKTEDIMVKMPQPQFIYPTEGMELKGQIKIEIKVEEASLVEFYLRRPQSLQEIYLGKAISLEKNRWGLNWDATKTPNGEYHLFSKITNQYGEYSGLAITITINNAITRDEKAEKILATQITAAEEAIKKEERAMTQTEGQTKEEIQKSMKGLVQETQEILEEPQKEMAEPKVSEELEESSKEIEGDIEKLVEKVKEEATATEEELEKIRKEKEEIKKEIIEKATEPIKPIEELAKEEVKPQILEKKKKAEEKIRSLLGEMEREILEKEKTKIEIAKKFLKDSDNDGLPDHEEMRLGTNPFNPDSDGDGFLDGIEIATGYDPLKPGPADKIVYQDPRKVEPKEANIYKVERVEMVTLPTGELGIKFEGKGRPNSFVTLYVFSPLLVLTTKTDGNGYWEYILDKPLSEGYHEIYVTVTNNGGEITARSEKFSFLVKPGGVAAIKPPEKGIISPAEEFQKVFILLIVAIIILAIGIALTIIGILTKRAKEKELKD